MLKLLGTLIYWVCGIWVFILCLKVIYAMWGMIGVVISFFLAPITFVVVPIYHGFTEGDWSIIVISYGGVLIATILTALHDKFAEQ
ncbi:hypothetical protein BAE46_05500 [Glaciecola punicea]|nr:hypothetical protein BAE46_05500 [Glaciecola punicea]